MALLANHFLCMLREEGRRLSLLPWIADTPHGILFLRPSNWPGATLLYCSPCSPRSKHIWPTKVMSSLILPPLTTSEDLSAVLRPRLLTLVLCASLISAFFNQDPRLSLRNLLFLDISLLTSSLCGPLICFLCLPIPFFIPNSSLLPGKSKNNLKHDSVRVGSTVSHLLLLCLKDTFR